MPLIRSTVLASWQCHGCKKAYPIELPAGAKVPEMSAYIRSMHREVSPRCPRDKAILSASRSYLDVGIREKNATPVFEMTWRDGDELGLTPEDKKGGPMIIIGG